jgi:tRNA nucleotidyltransferase/poly(A) polymerase
MSELCHQLQCYLVGGAVRDTLLGLAESDRERVVIGSSIPRNSWELLPTLIFELLW